MKIDVSDITKDHIPEWNGITDYRPFVKEDYDFDFSLRGDYGKQQELDNEEDEIYTASLNYARHVVGDPCNSKWLERRKLCDAFEMGIEYAKRYMMSEPIC